MKFIIAYDIANPRRLRRVAKRLEQSAVRVQKSVFVFHGTRHDLDAVKGDLVSLIDVAEDRLQAWPAHDPPGIVSWTAGVALPGRVMCAVLCPDRILYVEDPQ
jgi:CRISPR-associated protein Cas2